MGSRITNGKLAGLVVHDARISLDNLADNDASATGSNYTQAGPRPGSAISADAAATLDPQVHAAQTDDLDLIVVRGGNAEIDGAGVGYRIEGDAETDYRGWNEPNVAVNWTAVEWTTTERWERMAAVTVPSNQNVVLVAQDTTGTLDLSAWTYDASTRTWGSRVTIATGFSGINIGLVIDDNERLIVFAATTTSIGEAYFSDDEGATWSLYADSVLDSRAVSGENHSAVGRDRQGNLLWLMSDAATGNWQHFASRNKGITFTKQDDGTAEIDKVLGACTGIDGSIHVLIETTGGFVESLNLASAFDSLDTALADSGTVEASTAGFGAIWCDADGVLYAAVFPTSPTNGIFTVSRSVDQGITWGRYQYTAVWAEDADGGVHPRAAAASGGDAIVLLNGAGATVASRDSIGALRLGGFESIEMPSFVSTGPSVTNTRGKRFSYGNIPSVGSPENRSFLPFETFSTQGWTIGGAGTETLDGEHDIVTTAGQAFTATLGITHPTFSGAERGHARFEITVDSGGSLLAEEILFAWRRADGTDDREIGLRFSTAGFALYDRNGPTQIGSDVLVDMTIKMQFLIHFSSASTVEMFYKRPEATAWIVGPTSGALTNDAVTPGAIDRWIIGHPGGPAAESHWGLLAWNQQDSSEALRRGITDTTEFDPLDWGKALSSVPYPVAELGDTTRRSRISLQGSPARKGETFDVTPLYDHGIDRVFPQISPSPDQPWRSTSVATAIDITIDVTGAAYDTSLDGSWLWCLYLGGTNFRQLNLQERADAAGSFSALGTWDASEGFTSLTYELVGDQLRPVAGTSAGDRYLHSNVLAGGYVILDPGGTPKVRKIVANDPGFWVDPSVATTAITSLRLEGIDGTELGTGTCHLFFSAGMLVLPQTDAAGNATRRFRLRIPVQDVAEDYYQIGAICLGALFAFGQEPDRSKSWRAIPNVRVEVSDAGTIYADKRGPIAREMTWSWQDGLNLFDIRNGADANFRAASASTEALVGDHDVSGQLLGALRQSESGELPVVGLLEVPAITTTVTDRDLFLYGRMVSPIQSNGVVQQGERVDSITIQELVG